VTERVVKHIHDDPPDVRQFNKEVPASVVAMLQRMLAKDPAERYQTPAALLRALEGEDRIEAPIQPAILANLAIAHEDDGEVNGRQQRRRATGWRGWFGLGKRFGMRKGWAGLRRWFPWAGGGTAVLVVAVAAGAVLAHRPPASDGRAGPARVCPFERVSPPPGLGAPPRPA
jgi:hypothetical protein